MNYSVEAFPVHWWWSAAVIYALLLLIAIWRAPWRSLTQGPSLHPFLGGCVALMFLWQFRAIAIGGIEYHFLGASLLTLLFGAPLAFVAISLILFGTVLNGNSDWQALPLNALVMGALPITITELLLRLVQRYLPRHFFIYIFINAFFAAALALVITMYASMILLSMGGTVSWEQLRQSLAPFIPLMAFPEAFITGAIMTLTVALRPQWVSSFDDERYLKNK